MAEQIRTIELVLENAHSFTMIYNTFQNNKY